MTPRARTPSPAGGERAGVREARRAHYRYTQRHTAEASHNNALRHVREHAQRMGQLSWETASHTSPFSSESHGFDQLGRATPRYACACKSL